MAKKKAAPKKKSLKELADEDRNRTSTGTSPVPEGASGMVSSTELAVKGPNKQELEEQRHTALKAMEAEKEKNAKEALEKERKELEAKKKNVEKVRGPISKKIREDITREHDDGSDIPTLAAKYKRTEESIWLAINRQKGNISPKEEKKALGKGKGKRGRPKGSKNGGIKVSIQDSTLNKPATQAPVEVSGSNGGFASILRKIVREELTAFFAANG